MKQKEKNRGKFFSIFIVVIMTMSVLGFLIGGRNSGEQKLKYNDITFTRKDNTWVALINDRQLVFDYFPEQVENINISQEIINKLNTLEIDTTYDLNDSFAEGIALSQYRFQQNIGAITNIYVRQGLTSNNTFNLPILTCENATDFVPVIYFKQSNETKIYSENKCIIIEADSEAGFLIAKDRLLYGYFKIIK